MNNMTYINPKILRENHCIWVVRRNVHQVTSYMQRSNIAHNLLISRGETMGKNSGDTTTTLRVYIWPRISVTGTDYH